MKCPLLYICCLALLVTFCVPSFAQEKIRTLKKHPYSAAPIEVVDRKIGNHQFLDESRVSGDVDWLQKLRLNIKNISDKTIISFDIALHVEKQGKMLTAVSFPIYFRTYTRDAPDNVETIQGGKKLGPLAPGEVVTVRISDQHKLKFDDILKQYGSEDFDCAEVNIGMVYFDDGTRWAFGKGVPGR
jgi:hypothetical protein